MHHACTALAAEGHDARVIRLPEPRDPDHLAHLDILRSTTPAPEAIRRIQTIRLRHTDRRPVTGTPIDDHALATITAAVTGEGARLHILPRDRVVQLAAAVSYAQRTEAAEQAWRAELAYWAGGTRPTGAGVPDWAIPEAPSQICGRCVFSARATANAGPGELVRDRDRELRGSLSLRGLARVQPLPQLRIIHHQIDQTAVLWPCHIELAQGARLTRA